MTEPEQSPNVVSDPAVETEAYAVREDPHHDDTDVDAALVNDTDDGKGGAVVPKEDFVSYEDPEADKEDDN